MPSILVQLSPEYNSPQFSKTEEHADRNRCPEIWIQSAQLPPRDVKRTPPNFTGIHGTLMLLAQIVDTQPPQISEDIESLHKSDQLSRP